MKTVNDIIWSDLFNDDTLISIHDNSGNELSLKGLRFEDDILNWGQFDVYLVQYFPSSNTLCIFLNYNMEVKEDDTT